MPGFKISYGKKEEDITFYSGATTNNKNALQFNTRVNEVWIFVNDCLRMENT